jgi:excisionase family DNA binding protein
MTEIERDPTTMVALEPLLSIDQVSDLLGISQSGIYRLLRGEELACVKVGGRTLIEPGAVRDFIAVRRRTVAATDGAAAGEEAA